MSQTRIRVQDFKTSCIFPLLWGILRSREILPPLTPNWVFGLHFMKKKKKNQPRSIPQWLYLMSVTGPLAPGLSTLFLPPGPQLLTASVFSLTRAWENAQPGFFRMALVSDIPLVVPQHILDVGCWVWNT